jgi:hypothetical protein
VHKVGSFRGFERVYSGYKNKPASSPTSCHHDFLLRFLQQVPRKRACNVLACRRIFSPPQLFSLDAGQSKWKAERARYLKRCTGSAGRQAGINAGSLYSIQASQTGSSYPGNASRSILDTRCLCYRTPGRVPGALSALPCLLHLSITSRSLYEHAVTNGDKNYPADGCIC